MSLETSWEAHLINFWGQGEDTGGKSIYFLYKYIFFLFCAESGGRALAGTVS